MASRLSPVFVLCLVVLPALLLPHVSGTGGDLKQEQQVLDKILGPDYDKRIRPEGNAASEGSKPTVVTINMYVREIEAIDTHKHEARFQLTFRQEWNDSRLAFDDMDGKIKYLTLEETSKVWKPQIFFVNSVAEQTYDLMSPNTMIRIDPKGHVLYSSRVSLTVSCPMDLYYFPHDVQTCKIVIASYSHTTDDLVILWKELLPVQVARSLNIPDFMLMKFEGDYASSRTSTGSYSALRADFVLKRDSSRYYRQVYGPSVAFLVLSCASLWLKSQKQRFLLSIVSVLLSCFLVLDTNQRLPNVAFRRSIDIWTGFVFLLPIINLLIVALSSYVPEAAADEEKERSAEDGAGEPLMQQKAKSKLEAGRKLLAKVTRTRFEVAARIAIPVLMTLFIVIYFVTQVGLREDLRDL